jgi:hypothetical protein
MQRHVDAVSCPVKSTKWSCMPEVSPSRRVLVVDDEALIRWSLA